MAAHLLRLRLDLLLGALRGDARQVVRVAAGLVLLVAIVVAACTGVLALADRPEPVALAVVVIGGSAVTLGFALAPLVSGTDDLLDPRRFAGLGVRPGAAALAAAVGGLLSVPAAALTAVAVCVATLWAGRGAPAVVAALGAVVWVLTCVLLTRVAAGLTTLWGARRRRGATAVVLAVAVVVVAPAIIVAVVLTTRDALPPQVGALVDVLAHTPLGAAVALPALAATPGAATAWPATIALATVAVLPTAWWGVARALTSTIEPPAAGRGAGGLGWFAVLPGTPAGAVAARSLLYWLHDSRYLVNLIIVPIASIVTMFPLLVVGVPLSTAVLVPLPLMALFFGWLPHNDVAYDSSAVWMHVAGGVGGTADRVGRLAPVLVVAVPILVVAVPVTVALHGDAAITPVLVGVTAALFLSGLGLSSIASAAAPYAATRPGDGPFQQPQRAGGSSAQVLVLLGTLAASAPVLWWAWQVLTGDRTLTWPTFWLGLGVGVGVLVVSTAIGALVFRRSGSRLMEFAETT